MSSMRQPVLVHSLPTTCRQAAGRAEPLWITRFQGPMQQSDFFDTLPKTRLEGQPEGFRYQEDLIGEAEERALLRFLRPLPLQHFDFHGHSARRRVLSFGWRYDY